jgi:CRP-like cAMP-binding protein
LKVWDLDRMRWLAGLPPDEAERLRTVSTRRSVAPGAVVFSPARRPESVYVLEAGLVRIFRVSPGGDEVSFGYVHPGEVFGELAVFDDAPRESFAEAMRRSLVWRIPREAFARALRADPSIAFEVGRQIESRFKRIESRLEDLALRDSYSRLARVLLQLCDQFGEPRNGGISIDLPLTQADLATFIGTTRQTISGALQEMKKRGLISRDGRRLCLLRPDEIRRQLEQGHAPDPSRAD